MKTLIKELEDLIIVENIVSDKSEDKPKEELSEGKGKLLSDQIDQVVLSMKGKDPGLAKKIISIGNSVRDMERNVANLLKELSNLESAIQKLK